MTQQHTAGPWVITNELYETLDIESAENYIYILEDSQGNTEQVKPEDGLKRLQDGTGFSLKVYRLWRTYEEKK